MKQPHGCQTDDCRSQGPVTIILSCHTPHLTETKCCRKHLSTIKELYREHKLWCHCRLPIITGMYRDKQKIRKLEEEKND